MRFLSFLVTAPVVACFIHVHNKATQRTFKLQSTLNRKESIDETLRENTDFQEGSTLFASEVSNFGVSTALAEEHILLGNYEDAIRLANEAMDIGAHTGQTNNIYSAYAEGILADALYHQGHHKEAAEKYREALRIYEQHFQATNGPETVELVGALQVLAWNMLSKREYEDAKSACATALGMTKKLLGPNSTIVAASMVNLAIAHLNTGNMGPEVENLFQHALEIFEEHKTVDNHKLVANIGTAHLQLGNLYYLRGDEKNAMKEYEEIERMYHTGQFTTVEAAAALKNLAAIKWRHSDFFNAERLLAQALFALETSELYGIEHEQTIRLREMLMSLRQGAKAPPLIGPPLKPTRKASDTALFMKAHQDTLTGRFIRKRHNYDHVINVHKKKAESTTKKEKTEKKKHPEEEL